MVPRNVPHVSRSCGNCNKIIYLAEPGPDGKGIQVQKGDTFTIPAGWLTLSLDPARSKGTFTRAGVNSFVRHLVFSSLPSDPEKVVKYLNYLDGEADAVLLASPRMKDLDINSESGMERAFERFRDDPDSIEHIAILLSAAMHRSSDILNNDESKKWLASGSPSLSQPK